MACSVLRDFHWRHLMQRRDNRPRVALAQLFGIASGDAHARDVSRRHAVALARHVDPQHHGPGLALDRDGAPDRRDH